MILFDDRYLNISREKLRGVDLTLDAHFPTSVGEASAGINATRTLTHYQQLTEEALPATIFNFVGEPAGFRARANAGLTHGSFGGFLFVNYTGSYNNQFTTPYSRIASWTTVDLTLQFDSTPLVANGPFSHIAVVASAQNLLNRDPPLFTYNYSGLLFDPANANGLRRYLSLAIRKKW